jgi:hypothetical protein
MRSANNVGHEAAKAGADSAEEGNGFMGGAPIVAAVLHSWDVRGLWGDGLRYHCRPHCPWLLAESPFDD